jgi:hypothetical protein
MLDAYLLKSIDGFGLGALHGFKIVKCGANQTKICFFLKGDPAEWKDESTGESRMVETIQLGQFSPKNDPWAANYVKQMGHARVNAERDHAKALQGTTNSDINLQLSGATIHTGKPGLLGGELAVDTETLHVVAAALEIPSLVDSLQQFGARNGNPYPMIFDRVIRCLGWHHDESVYGEGVKLWMQHNKKYPVMTSEYESVSSPGLYFAGQLGHGKDHKRSAGGFIHGFRYTTRALFRMLEMKYQLQPWPARSEYIGVNTWDGGLGLGGVGCNVGEQIDEALGAECVAPPVFTTPFEKLLNNMFSRIDVASGPYQMVAILGDGIVFRCPSNANGVTTIDAEYLEEMPLEHFNQRYKALPRLFWSFGYRKQRHSLWESKQYGTFFQVQFWYHAGDCAAADQLVVETRTMQHKPGSTTDAPLTPPLLKELVQIHEDVHTRWGQPSKRMRVGRWLHNKLVHLRPGAMNPNVDDVHWMNPGRNQEFKDAEMMRQMSDFASEVGNDDASDENSRASGKEINAHAKAQQEQVPPPSISINWGRPVEETTAWEGAHVDINWVNHRPYPVTLYQCSKTDCDNGNFEIRDPRSPFEAIMEGDGIQSGKGIRTVSHEYDRWEARTAEGERVGRWWIDRSNGLLQDIAI